MRNVCHCIVPRALAILVATGSIVFAQSASRPRSERMRLDKDTGEWVDIAPPVPGTADGDLAIARTMFAAEDYRRAHRAIKGWLKTYGVASELRPEALLLQARILKARRDYYKAHLTLKEILADYPGTEVATDAVGEAYNIAEVFLSGMRRKLLGFRVLSAENLALDILDGISVQFPESSIAEQAILLKADHYFQSGDFGLAELEYNRLVQTFPRSRFRRYAMRRGAEAALAGFGGVLFDDAPLIEAEERYRMYAVQYPGVAEQEGVGLILADIREKRANKEFEVGAYYERTEHRRAATFYYRSVFELWPDTIAAARAREAITRLTGGVEEVGPPAGAGVTTHRN